MVFRYQIQASGEEPVAIHVEERITSDSNVVWANSQNIPVLGSTEIERFGPVLPAGNYKLIVETTHGSETARMTREFLVKTATPPPAPSLLPALIIAALFASIFAAFFLAGRYLVAKRPLPTPIMPVVAEAQPGQEEEDIVAEEKIKLFEAESNGIPPEFEIARVVEMAGFKGKKRENAIENAGKAATLQQVKSFIVMGKGKKAKFETTVRISLANNTNRNWENVVLLARIPHFLGKTVSQISEDTRVKVRKKGQLARFKLEKIGAMQSATFAYTVPRLVSQTEANSVPLPAVVSYREGEPLIITQIKAEKPQAIKENEEEVKKFYNKIEAKEKKGQNNKIGPPF